MYNKTLATNSQHIIAVHLDQSDFLIHSLEFRMIFLGPAQCLNGLKHLANKPGDLNLIPGTMVERKN